MKKKLLAGMATGLLMMGMAGMANAISFDISNINFEEVGNNWGIFNWKIDAAAGPTKFDLIKAGDNQNFRIGTFTPSGVGQFSGSFADSFKVSLDVDPPGKTFSGNAQIEGSFFMVCSNAIDYFNNISSPNPIYVTLDTGDKYSLTFNNLDITSSLRDMTPKDLYATITLLPDDSGNSGSDQVPEPATMLLFGIGLVGLAGLGRKKLS
jgi:hypothetical protein